MSRIWTVSVTVECATCGTKDDKASVAATSCEAAREGDAMRRTAGIRAGVRALDALLDLGWRPGGGR